MYTNDSLDSRYAGQDLSNRDLRGFHFAHCALYGTDVRGSNLHGATISLDCATFDGLKVDDEQMAKMLLMLTKADAKPEWAIAIRDAIARCVDSHTLITLRRFMQIIE